MQEIRSGYNLLISLGVLHLHNAGFNIEPPPYSPNLFMSIEITENSTNVFDIYNNMGRIFTSIKNVLFL